MNVTQVCGYYLNAKKKKPSKRRSNSKYNTNFRFYFTSAKISPLKAISKTEVKKLVAGERFTGMIENEGVGFEQPLKTNESEKVIEKKIEKQEEEIEPGDFVLTTRVIDTAREKIRQEVLLA